MRRRYDLRKSDNYMGTGKITYVCSGSGTFKIITGFPVTRATVSFATIPCITSHSVYSSSSSSSSEDITQCPRIYVHSYAEDGFYVAYEGIVEEIGYIEVNYSCV